MSKYLSFDIQEKIMKRLPVESLIRFRGVSTSWKDLIDSSRFISHSHHRHRHTHPHHLLVSNQVTGDLVADDMRFLSLIDDDTFPRQLSVTAPTVPLSVQRLFDLSVVGCSHGLICVNGYASNLRDQIAVLWNPSIRKSVVVPVSKPSSLCLGFGVCPVTRDPKLLSIKEDPCDGVPGCYVASVYTLSSGKWRSIPMPYGECLSRTETTKKFIYTRSSEKKLVSFDLFHETFEAIDLPDGLASEEFYTCKIRESLAVIIPTGTEYGEGSGVWMLEEDVVPRSFTNLYNIITPSKLDRILGSRQNGMLIMLRANPDYDDNDVDDDDCEPPSLVVYEPNSPHTNAIEIGGLTYEVDAPTHVIEIVGFRYQVDVQSYEETLLLLNSNRDRNSD